LLLLWVAVNETVQCYEQCSVVPATCPVTSTASLNSTRVAQYTGFNEVSLAAPPYHPWTFDFFTPGVSVNKFKFKGTDREAPHLWKDHALALASAAADQTDFNSINAACRFLVSHWHAAENKARERKVRQ
jgi:hypothetical protein